MEEIQVGEFVRTKKKGIFKVLSIKRTPYGYYCGITDNDKIATFTIGKGGNAEIKNDILKHSFNLIDLIEENDYVNGQLVEKIHRKEKDRIYYEFLENADGSYEVMEMCELKNIKSIVTHEQFASLEYKVED